MRKRQVSFRHTRSRSCCTDWALQGSVRPRHRTPSKAPTTWTSAQQVTAGGRTFPQLKQAKFICSAGPGPPISHAQMYSTVGLLDDGPLAILLEGDWLTWGSQSTANPA